MSVLRFWRDLTFQYPCLRSRGNLTEGVKNVPNFRTPPLLRGRGEAYRGRFFCAVPVAGGTPAFPAATLSGSASVPARIRHEVSCWIARRTMSLWIGVGVDGGEVGLEEHVCQAALGCGERISFQ